MLLTSRHAIGRGDAQCRRVSVEEARRHRFRLPEPVFKIGLVGLLGVLRNCHLKAPEALTFEVRGGINGSPGF
jgi:hypothetical protein